MIFERGEMELRSEKSVMGVMGRRRERFEGADEGGDTSEYGGRTSALSLGISL
jgi:hypothetical protein